MDVFKTSDNLVIQKQALPAKVSALTLYGDYLLVGTQKGDLLSYKVDAKKLDPVNKKKIGRGIQQMQIVPALKAILILCDGKIVAHHPESLLHLPEKIEVDNAAMFCVDTTDAPYAICVAHSRKKKAVIYSFDPTLGKYDKVREVAVPDTVLSMAWYGPMGKKHRQYICFAYKREYTLLDPEGDQVVTVPLQLDGSHPPCILPIDQK